MTKLNQLLTGTIKSIGIGKAISITDTNADILHEHQS